MLDEPSMGLAPTIADFIFERLLEIRADAGLTILLVEQRVAEALELADHGYVLETGRVVLEGHGRDAARRRSRPPGLPRHVIHPHQGGLTKGAETMIDRRRLHEDWMAGRPAARRGRGP